jgi:hypothetical protein
MQDRSLIGMTIDSAAYTRLLYESFYLQLASYTTHTHTQYIQYNINHKKLVYFF